MAGEAARSGPSVDTYIGSMISLTSKSEIRYEGVLYNINPEESSIGLRNVRSFGTEGRKKDGPQIPASDKIYEYILFRGTDIKDLQVKSSPPAAQSASIQNDPAVIQTHYVTPASTSSSFPSVVSGNVGDVTSHTAQLGLPRSTLQGNLPLYQSGGALGSWGSSSTPPNANGSGLAMPPMYWQGYYAPSSGLHLQQQTFLRPPPGMPIHSMQQQLQYPGMNISVPSGPQNLSEFPPPLLQPTNSTSGLTSGSLPSLLSAYSASTSAHETSSMLPSRAPVTNLPPSTLAVSLPLAPPMTSTIEPISIGPQSMPVVSSKANTMTVPTVTYQAVSQSAHSVASSSASTQVETSVQLVTPSQLLLTVSTNQSPPQPLQASQRDADAKAVEAKAKLLFPESSVRPASETKESILPLPKPSMQKPSGPSLRTHYYNRGRGRGRGNEFSRAVTDFTEEFDFIAMNEKFNKDEVWGHLGKNKAHMEESDGGLREDDIDYTLEEHRQYIKPVYVKDEFFDSLSSTTLDHGSRNGRTRFSEQLKIDAETFGDSARHRPSRGGSSGFRGSARGRGSYYGRGYGYVSRGRGQSFWHRSA